jgi:putative colanic acid biosynthesis acetyltransferase WcaF
MIRPRLEKYENQNFDRGAPAWKEALWIVVQALLVTSPIPGSYHRCFLLRLFGASIAAGVVIKPGVRVKFPWFLKVGKHSWLGENCWIDNLARVSIAQNCCLSQGTYLGTGNHDWTSGGFELQLNPINLHDYSWLAAQSRVGPGVTIGEGAVLSFASMATGDLAPWTIYSGVPCQFVKKREMVRSSRGLLNGAES